VPIVAVHEQQITMERALVCRLSFRALLCHNFWQIVDTIVPLSSSIMMSHQCNT